MAAPADRARSSRRRYRAFVDDYRQGRLDTTEADRALQAKGSGVDAGQRRRAYVRDYLR